MNKRLWLLFFCIIGIIITTNIHIKLTAKADSCLTFTYQDKSWQYEISDNNSNMFEIESGLQKRNKLIKDFGYEQTYNFIISLGIDSEKAINYIFPRFDKFYKTLSNQIEKKVVEPKLHFKPNSTPMFLVEEGVNGIIIDKENLFIDLLSGKNEIKIKTKIILPTKNANELLLNTKLRSCESTSFINSESGRKHNLLKAMEVFNGITVKPGEVISFNKTTGSRDYKDGYKDAIVILDGKFVKGVGGGVCQASTTLYNAALMAGLEITKVCRHTLPIGYVAAGFDAMVNDGYADMCFKNNTNSDIFIKTYHKNERVYAEIYGESLNGISYEKESEKIRDIDPDTPTIIPDDDGKYKDHIKYKGEFYTERYPKKGYEVKGYLKIYKDGVLIDKKLVRHEKYLAQNEIKYEGTLDPPAIKEDSQN